MNPFTAPTIIVLLFTALPATTADQDDLDRILAFEGSRSGAAPAGWGGGPPETLFADGDVVHGGSWCGRIERTSESPEAFSTLTTRIPMDFAGAAVELRGFLRTENVRGWAGLWMREDGESGSVAFDNMQSRELHGTTEWTEYTIRLPIDKAGVKLFFGALLVGEGKVWVDDLRLLVDGKPLREAPTVERPETVLGTDREFDAGSQVTIDTLTPDQTANLATLGKVWGFLKYHHPKVVAGDVHWDFELFRVLPHVLAAADRSGAQQAILDWAKKLGDVAACDPCATLPDGLALRPDLATGSTTVRRSASLWRRSSNTSIATDPRAATRPTSRWSPALATRSSVARRGTASRHSPTRATGSWRSSAGGASFSTGRPIVT